MFNNPIKRWPDEHWNRQAKALPPERPNLPRKLQVLPPHIVDLTLAPTTLEQIRALPTVINQRRR
jgi:hypothetical protein